MLGPENLKVISVVTPSYNQGRYLEQSIRNVLSQAEYFHIDYFVVDGGSGDGLVEIIRRFDDPHNTGKWSVLCRGIRFRWLSEKVKGQVLAMIKGFGIASGEILGSPNSDDTHCLGPSSHSVAYGK